MEKYKNTLFSFLFLIAAPLWYFLSVQIGLLFIKDPSKSAVPPVIGVLLTLIPYFIFLIIGIFFGSKNLKLKQPSIIGNIVTLLGIIMLLLSLAFLGWVSAWHA